MILFNHNQLKSYQCITWYCPFRGLVASAICQGNTTSQPECSSGDLRLVGGERESEGKELDATQWLPATKWIWRASCGCASKASFSESKGHWRPLILGNWALSRVWARCICSSVSHFPFWMSSFIWAVSDGNFWTLLFSSCSFAACSAFFSSLCAYTWMIHTFIHIL